MKSPSKGGVAECKMKGNLADLKQIDCSRILAQRRQVEGTPGHQSGGWGSEGHPVEERGEGRIEVGSPTGHTKKEEHLVDRRSNQQQLWGDRRSPGGKHYQVPSQDERGATELCIRGIRDPLIIINRKKPDEGRHT